MKRALLVMALAFVGCGGVAGPRPTHGGAAPTGRAGDATYVVSHRAFGGRVHLLLAIDAGTRDATPPPVATLASWLLARHAGGDVEGFAGPDLVGLSLDCPVTELRGCVARLFTVLAVRDVGDAELSALRRQLGDARTRTAGDEARRADALALAAALGDDAAIDALGTSGDDGALDVAHLRAFLAAHVGVNRALLVAVGDVDERSVRDATERAVTSAHLGHAGPRGERAAPRATGGIPRGRSGSEPSAPGRDGIGSEPSQLMPGVDTEANVRAEAGDDGAVSAALRVASLGQADGIAAAVPGAQIVVLRGATIVLARGTDARSLVRALESARRETDDVVADPAPLPLPDDVRESARSLAVAWAARGADASGEDQAAIALGVVTRSAPNDEPDAAILRARALRAYLAGLADAAPTVRGTLGATASSVVADDGARIETRRRETDGGYVLSLRFAGDAGGEPRVAHGRTRMLAEALASRCSDARSARGAMVTPAVSATSFGVDARAPSLAALDRALACALTVVPDAADLVRGAAAVVDADAEARLRATTARLLAPETPGLVAPGGDPRSPPGSTYDDALAALTAARSGARTAIGVAGDAPADELARHAARRAAVLPAGTAAPELEAGPPAASDLLAAPSTDGATHVVLAWRTTGVPQPGTSRDDARALVLALARTLADHPGVRVRAAVGDASSALAFVALALDVDDAALDALPATWAAAVAAVAAPTLAQARDAVARETALVHATLEGEAAELAERRLAPRSQRVVELGALAASVLAAPPHVEIARARPTTPPRAAPVLVRPPRSTPVRRPRGRRAR